MEFWRPSRGSAWYLGSPVWWRMKSYSFRLSSDTSSELLYCLGGGTSLDNQTAVACREILQNNVEKNRD